MTTKTNEIKKNAQIYFDNLEKLFKHLDYNQIVPIVKMIDSAYRNNRQIFIFGNGGSAASAAHIAVDLNKGTRGHKGDIKTKPFRVICLNDAIPTMTAWANDTSYDDIFSEQLKNLARKGDLVIGISASGNSPNVVKALLTAKKIGVKTIALVGFSGGKARKIADQCLYVNSNEYGPVEDIHLIFGHFLTAFYYERNKKTTTSRFSRPRRHHH